MTALSIHQFLRSYGTRISGGRLSTLWLCALLSVCTVGCSSISRSSGVEQQNQATAAEVKVALAREPGVSAAPLNVVADNGVVTIDGFVETDAQKRKIQQAASRVEGVTEVRLQVEVR